MLSIGAMKGGQHSYYLQLAREDYYLHGGEPPGLWHGQGATDLGLAGRVEGETLTRLFEGMHPTEARFLVQQQHYQERQNRPGWDFTFSAPKSLSVLWSQAAPDTRRTIQEAHTAGVKAALNYLENEIAVTRKRGGGTERVPARLVVAIFEHHTSRAQDPQIHTHALILNVCTDAEGKTRTVESRPLFRAKMTAGALYRAELAAQVETRLNLSIARTGSVFEVEGVSFPLVVEMSKRRAAIEKALLQRGAQGAASAARAALQTRQIKGHLSQEALTATWQATGKALGWGPEQASRLLAAARPRRHDRHTQSQEALEKAGERATEKQSAFCAREFTRALAEEAPGRGLDVSAILKARDAYLAESPAIVRLGRHRGERTYTTREMMAEERALLTAVEQSKPTRLPGVSESTIESVITTRQRLNPEQGRALRHLTETGGSIRLVAGMAGTGKTTLLRAARLAWELEGFEVRGAALGGKAAKGLEKESGIPGDTLRRTLWELSKGKRTLHAKSVLVVDEAGMVGTRMMRQIVDVVQKAMARLVLVGDARQLQPIEAGGAFSEIARRINGVHLTQIQRQSEPWARDTVRDFADGRAKKGLRAFAERGLLTVESDRRKAMEALILAWKEIGVRSPQDTLILAGTRLEASILNRLAQEERRKAGQLQGEGLSLPDSNETLYVRDRVLFTVKSRLYGVENGSQGEVMRLDLPKRALTIRLDDGERVQFSLDHYAHVLPGYALTTHKAQGATTRQAFILVGGAMQDREISYVQVSRSVAQTRLFVDVEEAGDTLTRLVRQMGQSRQKEMAHTLERANMDRVDREREQRAPRRER